MLNEKVGDLISRSALLAELNDDKYTWEDYDAVEFAVQNLPAVDAVPVDIVAQMICDAIGDPCACNVNGNDEWLAEVCDLQNECPYPQGRLDCWKQYIKHYGERRADQ